MHLQEHMFDFSILTIGLAFAAYALYIWYVENFSTKKHHEEADMKLLAAYAYLVAKRKGQKLPMTIFIERQKQRNMLDV